MRTNRVVTNDKSGAVRHIKVQIEAKWVRNWRVEKISECDQRECDQCECDQSECDQCECDQSE